MNLFAYGTLMDPEIMAQVSGNTFRSQKGTLFQYVRKTVWGEIYPAIFKRNGSSVDGIIYFDISAEAFARLDKFEGPLFVKKKVMMVCDNGENVGTYTYVIAPDSIHQLSDDDWNYEDFLANDKQLFQSSFQGYSRLKVH